MLDVNPSLKIPDREALLLRLGLSDYHLFNLENAERAVGIRGQRVLEVGGNLPREMVIDMFGAKQWIGVEDFSHYDETSELGNVLRPTNVLVKLAEAPDPAELPNYALASGKIEELPSTFEGKFDRIFSIACFEHITTLGFSLEKMWLALAPGGMLYSYFAPIWPSPIGHHLPRITDSSGKTFSFTSSPIDPWAHLVMTPPEMFHHLRSHTDIKTASVMTFYIYNSSFINRLFVEDYEHFFRASKFSILHTQNIQTIEMPKGVEKILRARNPPYKIFNSSGMLVVLKRDS